MEESNRPDDINREPREDIQRWTAKRRAALALSIVKGEITTTGSVAGSATVTLTGVPGSHGSKTRPFSGDGLQVPGQSAESETKGGPEGPP